MTVPGRPRTTFDDIYEEASPSMTRMKMNRQFEQQIAGVEKLIGELESLYPTMPKVKPDGQSECPFAPDLFLKKQRLENELSTQVSALRRTLGDIEREIARCRRNLARISGDAQAIETAVTRSKYAEGMGRQEQEYYEALSMRKEAGQVLRRANGVLAASRQKKFPVPLHDDGPSGDLSVSASSFLPPPDGLRDEVNDLISMGGV